jgi:trimeric autotransporter adhesin
VGVSVPSVRSGRRRWVRLTILVALIMGTFLWSIPWFADPQSKLYAASFKAHQIILGPLLSPEYLGDGAPAQEMLLCDPMGLAADANGNLYVADRGRVWRGRVVWRIGTDGLAHVVAGTGHQGDAEGTQALEVSLGKPEGLALDLEGRVHLADAVRHTVYRFEHDGTVARIAGTGSSGFSGDGGPAKDAKLNRPAEIRFDRQGNLYIADVFNHRVRRVTPNGLINTVAGTGESGFTDDGSLAVESHLDTPWGIGIDLEDRLLIGDAENHRIRRVEHDGTLITVAGNGIAGYSGDGGPALSASFDAPQALFVDDEGRLFIGDEHNHAVRVVDLDGNVSTLMGTGERGFAPAGSQAGESPLNDPENLVVLEDGSVVIAEGRNGRIIRVTPEGVVEEVAGRSAIEQCVARLPIFARPSAATGDDRG